jgi:hypothetical protein
MAIRESKSFWRGKTALLVALVALALILYALERTGAINLVGDKPEKQDSAEQTDDDIDYGPPTDEEQQAGNDQKEGIVKDDEKDTDSEEPRTNTDKVSVAIVDASQYDDVIEVRAYVQGVIKAGKCIAVFTKDGQTVSKTVDAFIDARNTQCEEIDIDRSEFPSSGDWKLVVKYKSENYAGSSGVETVSID